MATGKVPSAVQDEEVDRVHTRHSEPGPSDNSAFPPGEPVGMETGYRILAYIAAGLLFYGGLGWLGDRHWGTHFLLPIGLVIGTVLSLYVIIRRYQADPHSPQK